MIYAIGTPNQTIRCFFHTSDPEFVELQLNEGEVFFEIDKEEVGIITLKDDGSYFIQPELKIIDPYVYRMERNNLLSASDWTQLPDVNLSPELQEQWRVYRQALRDLDFTTEPVWPTPPA